MGFEKFGRKGFTSQTRVSAFVDYLEKGELCATRCPACGRVYFPPRADCAGCLGSGLEWAKIEGNGSLVSYTRVNYGPAGFESDAPYTLALVDFNGVKVFGQLNADVPETAVRVGMLLQPAVVTLPGGQVTYEFLPA
ncbi:Zn-ribbon domain-containing OB-fold protein [Desulfotomaculum copahuensis]|uniref:DNA-binding protein n=1 Tax=Desulfotomaculum copahuensis TaxID=1838280 RepID=A0A1B7LGZ3_9FIRM|nr:Zn-ribbon domain-containing OB-fold protein [Desulfotomaculum copahuensis]OAT85279.1 DNA-binding protein [Desulfotomaculum copahuensis]